ncbi:DUF6429 family protein [Halobacillus salinus]|uniref:DUF6429 family protein n=1 Tax=Halobacillus salinus TaxID=192814 RepID=UPI0009A7114A|nr:DUF6429 family protein [Halobacillus salinus]
MEDEIKELTLLLLYLTSWKENDIPDEMSRSWKGYPFWALNELGEEDYLRGGKRGAKSVFLTEEGIKKAEELAAKYLADKPS